MTNEKRNYYVNILKKELIPAMGCTEPIAVAYAASKAVSVLGKKPDKFIIECSGNIIKNVKGVTVPNSGGAKGVEVAAVLGAIAGNCEDVLNVLSSVTPDDVAECNRLIAQGFCSCKLAEDVDNLYISAKAYSDNSSAEVTIEEAHTNITKITKDGNVLFSADREKNKITDSEEKTSISDILEFAQEVDIDEIRGILEPQIHHNMALSNQGLLDEYGANIGKAILKLGNYDLNSRIKGKVAAASDARMAGENMPVVINSGSGNQGIAVSIPVVEYAKDFNMPYEKLLRALAISNLTAMHIKKRIGNLSAFCGAVSAAAGAGAGIGFLMDFSENDMKHIIEATLLSAGGIFCDGAKSSCAAKLAISLEAMLISLEMIRKHNRFGSEEGLIGRDADETISNICHVAKNGMSYADKEILKIMNNELHDL